MGILYVKLQRRCDFELNLFLLCLEAVLTLFCVQLVKILDNTQEFSCLRLSIKVFSMDL